MRVAQRPVAGSDLSAPLAEGELVEGSDWRLGLVLALAALAVQDLAEEAESTAAEVRRYWAGTHSVEVEQGNSLGEVDWSH